MSESFNWDELDSQFANQFKAYAENGTYDVKLESVTQKVAGTGTIFFEFNFEETEDTKFPKISRAFFKDEKKNFRMHHYKEIMKVLGASEDNARKAVEVCEGKANRDAIADAYTQTFNKLAQKHPTIKLEVSTEVNQGKEYARGEFKDPAVHFGNKKESKPAEVVPTDIPEEGEDLLDSIPF